MKIGGKKFKLIILCITIFFFTKIFFLFENKVSIIKINQTGISTMIIGVKNTKAVFLPMLFMKHTLTVEIYFTYQKKKKESKFKEFFW